MPIVTLKGTINAIYGKAFLFSSHMHGHVENRYMQLHNYMHKTRYPITHAYITVIAFVVHSMGRARDDY